MHAMHSVDIPRSVGYRQVAGHVPAEAPSRLHLAGGDVDDVAVRIGEPDRLHVPARHGGNAIVPLQALGLECQERDALFTQRPHLLIEADSGTSKLTAVALLVPAYSDS